MLREDGLFDDGLVACSREVRKHARLPRRARFFVMAGRWSYGLAPLWVGSALDLFVLVLTRFHRVSAQGSFVEVENEKPRWNLVSTTGRHLVETLLFSVLHA